MFNDIFPTVSSSYNIGPENGRFTQQTVVTDTIAPSITFNNGVGRGEYNSNGYYFAINASLSIT
jgi:hypothetical protein